MLTANEIRQQFIDFFVKKHGHTFVPSSSVVPLDDPTLLFTNAGMNQFKPYFLGTERALYKRAANTQKCIRAGGKHNDLDDVGKDTYHHTFFEMLGNWSFGDYFKKEAIRWAWELLTDVWKLDKTRLHATVFEGGDGVEPDDEAASLWRSETDIDPSHIHKGNKKDNFWEMGETGPCGPCTEIHIDRTPNKTGGKLVNAGTADVIEIWNLVFIQFNRGADKKLTPLPAKHVDTGMGFERVTSVLQGKNSNYDTDVFTPIMDGLAALVHRKYGGKLVDMSDVAFRVIADHLRMLSFSITDGAMPSNKDRGSVVRSVLRRAFRFGYQYFEQREPFLWKLVPALVEQMGGAFPELMRSSERVQSVIKAEEADFLRTIERGLTHFTNAVVDTVTAQIIQQHRHGTYFGVEPKASWISERIPPFNGTWRFSFRSKDGSHMELVLPPMSEPERVCEFLAKHGMKSATIAAKAVFDLHTTYGFPPDLSQVMARERGLSVDMEGYKQLQKEHAAVSRGQVLMGTSAVSAELPETKDTPKYTSISGMGNVLGWLLNDNTLFVSDGTLGTGEKASLLLDQTNFYAEQGGQVGDEGMIITDSGSFKVEQTKKLGGAILHIGFVEQGNIEVGDAAKLQVGGTRSHTMRNHTATHLLNWALRKVLGEHIEQKGSYVDAEKTRFDFAHDKPLSTEEVAEVERLVNEKIYADLPVTPVVMPLAEAKKIPGVRAVFGEKYPDPVRVLLIGATKPEDADEENSVEFCGGTHLSHTGQAGFFKIVGQELVGKGVRRVTAVTGREAVATVQRLSATLDNLAGRFNCKPEEVPARVESMQEELKKLQIQIRKGAAGDASSAADKLLADATEVAGVKVIVGEMPAAPTEQMRTQMDRLRQKAKNCAVLFGWVEDGKVGLLASMTEDAIKKGLKAGDLIRAVAEVVKGKGGGRPEMAQGGGTDPSKLNEALALAKKLAVEKLGA